VLAHSTNLDTADPAFSSQEQGKSTKDRSIDSAGGRLENGRVPPKEWACGAAGSALPWHGRGHRFDPDQVHHNFMQGSPEESRNRRKLPVSAF
jgi:hypothetical protein